jgi:hypothetical protein
MPLFVVHPSRGTWAFFGLIALGIVAVRAYGSYERSVVRRDGPASELAQDLGVCIFGNDSVWLLRDEPQAVWQQNMADCLRRAATRPDHTAWPGRCVPVADRLIEKLDRTPGRPEQVKTLASQVRESLHAASRDRFDLIQLVDDDTFVTRLSTLFAMVRELSQGTRERWAPVPANFDRYGALPSVAVPQLNVFGRYALQPSLASATTVYYFSPADGMTHAFELAQGRDHRDSVVGPAVPWLERSVPWLERARGGVVRAETEAAPALLTGGDVPRVVPFPRAFKIDGDPREFAWDAAASGDALALLTLDHNTPSVYVTPRDGPVAWTPHATLTAAAEGALAAVIAPGGTLGSWRVTTLRPLMNDGVVEQFTVTRPAPAADDPASGEAPLVVSPPSRRTERESESVNVAEAHTATCAHGDLRYIVVVNGQWVQMLRVEAGDVRVGRLAGQRIPGRNLSLVCDRDRALVSSDVAAVRGMYVLFDFSRGGSANGTTIEVPMNGPSAQVRAVDLVPDGLVALVSNRTTLRTYRYGTPPRASSPRWESAGLVALLKPAWRPRNPPPERTLRRVSLVTEGDRVTVLMEGNLIDRPTRPAPPPRPAEGDNAAPPPPPPPAREVPYVSVATSTDGGRRFSSP